MERQDAARYDVIVVGGGLSGCAMATALADGGRKILVLEARAGKNPRFNGELIHPHGVDILDERGFLEPLHRAGGADVRGFAVVQSGEKPTTLLPYDEIPGSRPFGFAIDHHSLVDTMRAKMLEKPGIELRLGERVVDLVRDQERVIGVMTAKGPALAPVVLACDGRHSKIRALIEMPEQARLLSFTAAALLEKCPLPNPGFGHIFLGAWGPILVYPIGAADARTCIDLPSDMDKGKEAVIARIRADYAPHLPEGVRATLVRALDSGDIEVAANYAIYTDECTVPGAALVGDSTGCSHPLTATGMTIALNDTRLLARELSAIDLRDRAQVDAALGRYQVDRYRFVRAREILADALYEVFRGTDDGTRAIREGIFQYWNASSKSRARSMALLSGHESRLPAFLREYLTVVGKSTTSVLRGLVNEPTVSGRVRSLYGLGKKSWEKFGIVAKGVREGSLR
ncbi:MAG: Monooxygenase, FAD-binding protein [Myxococcales bacterium]|nr:Monooxygenase, FAD-binding protein [Myxococcales bacterium]